MGRDVKLEKQAKAVEVFVLHFTPLGTDLPVKSSHQIDLRFT